LHRAELTVCCCLIRFFWHGASCPREFLSFSIVSSPEVQKRREADVNFQAAWAHVSNQEHQVSPRGASDWWRESVRKSVSVHQDKIRGSAILRSCQPRTHRERLFPWRPVKNFLVPPPTCLRAVMCQSFRKRACLIFGTRTIGSSIFMARTKKGLLRLKSVIASDFRC